MENSTTATEVQDEQVVSALPLSADEDEGDDDGAEPIRSLPRPGKPPAQPTSQTRSDSTDLDGDRRLRPTRPSASSRDASPSNPRLPA